MKKTLGLLSLVATAAFAAPAAAQIPNVTPFSFEVRAGGAFPTGDFGEDSGDDSGDVKSGYTLGANATFHLMPLIGIYGGYTYNRFGLENLNSVDAVDQGIDLGVRLAIPTPLIPIDPYVKAGLVYHRLGLEGPTDGEDFITDSDSSLGFEVGAGIGLGIGPKLSFTPQVTYTRYEPKFDGEGIDLNVEHVRVDVGLRLRL